MIFLAFLFWLSVLLLLHTYFLYPMLLRMLTAAKPSGAFLQGGQEKLPAISILLAVYNEEKVIAEKIESTFRTTYPHEKMEWLIGSDQSTDLTESLINGYQEKFPQIRLVRFNKRTGKIGIMNELAAMATAPILVLTDANVFFTGHTLEELVKHFADESVAMVAGNIINPSVKPDGISRQEGDYLFYENRMKYQESMLWGAMMGAFGGCYAMRKGYFSPIPRHFIVDDFYLTMRVLEQGGKAILSPLATCYEDVSNKLGEEFRRKTRIATGNFQNLFRFAGLLSPAKGAIAFAFWSHKTLRWIGPLLLLVVYFSSFVLSFSSFFFWCCFLIQSLLFLVPVIDAILRSLKIHIKVLRYISHFYLMNAALLNGLFNYLIGAKNNVWKPTERNQ